MARAFNGAWEYLDKKRRTDRDDLQMLTLVHAARYHAKFAGTARNQAIGDWQVSRAYAAVGEPRLALAFARSSLALCEQHELSDILCTAYEAVARAFAVAGDPKAAREYLAKARAQLDATPLEAESREIFQGQIRETERMVRRVEG